MSIQLAVHKYKDGRSLEPVQKDRKRAGRPFLCPKVNDAMRAALLQADAYLSLPPRDSRGGARPGCPCEAAELLLVVRGDQRGVRKDMTVHGFHDICACRRGGYIELLVEGKKLNSVMV